MKLILLSLITMFVTSCKTYTRNPASLEDAMSKVSTQYSQTDEDFDGLTNEVVKFRLAALKYFQDNECKVTKSKSCKKSGKATVFTGKDLDLLYQGLNNYLSLREQLLMQHISPNANLLPVGFLKAKNEVVESTNGFKTSSIKQGKETLIRVEYDPSDIRTREFYLRLKYAVAAGLMIYDTYLMAIKPYTENHDFIYKINADFKVRRKILTTYNVCEGTVKSKDFDPNNTRVRQDVLNLISDEYWDTCRRDLIGKAMQLIAADWEIRRKTPGIAALPEEEKLDQVIKQSPFFYMLQNENKKDGIFVAIHRWLEKTNTWYNWNGRGATYYISKGFGNTIGKFQERSGKMKNLKKLEKDLISGKLRSMDLILEKTPFRKTDKFIPGYYGHAAIWVGSKEELQQLKAPHPETGVETPVWEILGTKNGKVFPELTKKYQSMVEIGHRIIEALRPGVQFNTLEHFLDVDDFLGLRDDSLTDRERGIFALRAFEQIGKDYDFNFDVETKERIVCSEIAYAVYYGYDWPTDKAIGRATISPDHVAWEADGGCFKPVVLWTDGIEINGNMQSKMSSLINGPEGINEKGKPQIVRRRNGCFRTPQ